MTILSTVEVEENFTELRFSHYTISFLTDDIIRLRYVEIDGQLTHAEVVVKMRGGATTARTSASICDHRQGRDAKRQTP